MFLPDLNVVCISLTFCFSAFGVGSTVSACYVDHRIFRKRAPKAQSSLLGPLYPDEERGQGQRVSGRDRTWVGKDAREKGYEGEADKHEYMAHNVFRVWR